MLHNPKWDKPSLAAFVAWLETMPTDGEYNYPNFHECALGRYASTRDEVYNYVWDLVIQIPAHNHIVYTRPWTYGAALQRASAVLERNG